jgi:hypothetical protein
MKRTNGFRAEDKKKRKGKELTFHNGRIIQPFYLFPHESNSKQKLRCFSHLKINTFFPNYLQSKNGSLTTMLLSISSQASIG